ncbi:MAG: hypothetical protein ACI8V8_002104 [Chitinophagales bacterium]|jgi:hypothetical protein
MNFFYLKLLTFCSDLEVMKHFTGPILEEAIHYDEDEQYLLDFPKNVSHYNVLLICLN